ncbi:hypothetical protein G9P44_003380 [Scheffersomyces stipitis]|nr:hypothetical protein G9P44_003380 [Scheffersomyces stipitis]
MTALEANKESDSSSPASVASLNKNATTATEQNTTTPTNSPNKRSKRSKTFTGCFTCRSRKIRCDLSKPFCNKCTKSGLICSGYDIKLRWSLPLQFNSKNGNAISTSVSFKSSETEEKEENPEFFQRRKVGFVVWDGKKNCRLYETYDEMDKDLGILHNSGNDKQVNEQGRTKLLGPFGVFLGSISSESSDGDRNPKRMKPNHSAIIEPTHKSLQNSYVSTPNLSDTNPDLGPNEHLWLSNELRDDAFITAAALNGDTQFLDFININDNSVLAPNSSSSNFSNHNNANTSSANYAFNANQNELLNLVFHRNHSNVAGNIQNNQQTNATPNESTGIPMQNILNGGDSSLAINPTNQKLHYSNYNNDYNNNPYSLNENLEIHLHASKTSNNEEESTDIVDGDHSNSVQMPTSIMSIVQSPLEPKLGFDLSIPNLPATIPRVGMPTTSLQVQPLTRYLLNYYITQVADLMTVIPLTENPWKTIYFPRALMAIGELSALGQTSTAKNALLNALLAVSAFNLQSKFKKHSDPMIYYLNLGIRLRNQASLFIKQLLSSKSFSNEKYKDVLCAVMTMISVDLVWGTMQDTSFYINWCGKVIAAKMVNKKKLSSKARILHRIFSSLKLIQDSTCLNLESIKEDFVAFNEIGYDVNGDKFGNQDSAPPATSTRKGRIDYIVNSTISSPKNPTKNTSPSFVNKKLINTKKTDEHFATDALYGLPNSLILLFSETVQLLRSKIYHSEVYNTLPKDFKERAENLNQQLINWKLDWQLYENQNDETQPQTEVEIDEDISVVDAQSQDDAKKKFFSPMHEATYHHILSFYHALMIYFNRLIMEVPPTKLQTKVAKTLSHLNAIQKLISKGEAAIIPLFWQGFIAGCEAVSMHLQMGFKKWGADIAQYLGSYWGARQIMLEVWRRKRMFEARDDWVSVIQDWEMNLMLN